MSHWGSKQNHVRQGPIRRGAEPARRARLRARADGSPRRPDERIQGTLNPWQMWKDAYGPVKQLLVASCFGGCPRKSDGVWM